jgi:hypothetical protein
VCVCIGDKESAGQLVVNAAMNCERWTDDAKKRHGSRILRL